MCTRARAHRREERAFRNGYRCETSSLTPNRSPPVSYAIAFGFPSPRCPPEPRKPRREPCEMRATRERRVKRRS
jgi:hypothetical protein